MPTWLIQTERTIQVRANTKEEALKEAANELHREDSETITRDPELSGWTGNVDGEGNPCIYLNHYACPDCDEEWSSAWSSQCDDECAGCGKSYTPVKSTDVE